MIGIAADVARALIIHVHAGQGPAPHLKLQAGQSGASKSLVDAAFSMLQHLRALIKQHHSECVQSSMADDAAAGTYVLDNCKGKYKRLKYSMEQT